MLPLHTPLLFSWLKFRYFESKPDLNEDVRQLLTNSSALAQSIKADTGDTRQEISTLTRDVANIQIREDGKKSQSNGVLS